MNVLRYPSCFFVYWKRATFYFQYNWNFLNVLSGRAIMGPCQTHVIGQALSKFRHYDILLDVLYRFHRRTRKKNERQQILYFLSSTVLMYVVFITIKANRTFLSGWFGGGCFFTYEGRQFSLFFRNRNKKNLYWLFSVAFPKIITALKSHMTCYNLNLYS